MAGNEKFTIQGVKIDGEFFTVQETRLKEAFKQLESMEAEKKDKKLKAARLKGKAALQWGQQQLAATLGGARKRTRDEAAVQSPGQSPSPGRPSPAREPAAAGATAGGRDAKVDGGAAPPASKPRGAMPYAPRIQKRAIKRARPTSAVAASGSAAGGLVATAPRNQNGILHKRWSPDSGKILALPLDDFSRSGNNTLTLEASMPNDGMRFALNLIPQATWTGQGYDDDADIAMHFNPRRHRGGQVILNNRVGGRWARGLTVHRGAETFTSGEIFELKILFSAECFAFYVNDKWFCDMEYRTPIPDGQPLLVWFGLADDFGHPDALALNWVWWGHNEDTATADRALHSNAEHGPQGEIPVSQMDCYVGGFNLSSSKSELRRIEVMLREKFAKYEVAHVRVIQEKGFAFIKFSSELGAKQAIQEMNGKIWADSGKAMRVSQAWANQHSVRY
jgi:hypothetical protein